LLFIIFATMGRILAIDYGKKRVGLAVTDILKISANPIGTVLSHEIWQFLKKYIKENPLEAIVVGYATQKDGSDSESMQYIHPFVIALKKKYKSIPVYFEDESYTSVIAEESLKRTKKAIKKDKSLIDTISATLILQSFLNKI